MRLSSFAVLAASGRGALDGGGAPVVFEPETDALLARFTSPADATRQGHINTLIAALKTAGVWAKLDAFYVMAAHDAQAAQRNWIADAFNLTPISAPTFTADRGYQGDGLSPGSHVDTGFNPTTQTATSKYSLNNCHISFWSRTSAQEGTTAGNCMGCATNLGSNARATNDTARAALNTSTTTGQDSMANTDGSGHLLFNRSTSTAVQFYRNGASLGTSSRSSAAIPNSNILVCSRNAAGLGSARQFAAAHFGQSLDATESLAVYNALAAYMTAVGA